DVRAVHDQRQVEVQPAGALETLAVGPGAQRRNGADVRPVEEIVLDAYDGVVGVIAPAGVRVEHADPPGPEPPIDPRAPEDRDRRATAVDPAAARGEP